MSNSNDWKSTRKVTIHLSAAQAGFIDQERARLFQETGLKFTVSELVRVLIEQHKTRMDIKAEADPESVAWMYRRREAV